MSDTPTCGFLKPSRQSALAMPPFLGAPPLAGGGFEAAPPFLPPAFLEMAMAHGRAEWEERAAERVMR